jgi:hypothetical protein
MHACASKGYILEAYGPDLLIVWWHLVVNEADQRYAHLGGVVASKNVADEVRFNLHVHLVHVSMFSIYPLASKQAYHFHCTPQHSDQYVRKP